MQLGEDKTISFSFPKSERLCSRLMIERLLAQKKSVFSYPFKCYYRFLPKTESDQVSMMAVTVPKKLERTAVGRNRIKRWTREAYRLNNKQILLPVSQQKNLVAHLLFVCVGKENLSWKRMENAVIQSLKSVCLELEKQ